MTDYSIGLAKSSQGKNSLESNSEIYNLETLKHIWRNEKNHQFEYFMKWADCSNMQSTSKTMDLLWAQISVCDGTNIY